jgi:hypothetical protein
MTKKNAPQGRAGDKNESVGWRSTDGRRTMRETKHIILMIPGILSPVY